MRILLNLLKWSGKTFGLLILFLLLAVAVQYITCPVYIFPEPSPFSGDTIFNPYRGINGNSWRKCNFQVQSYAWCGLTDGRKNRNEHIDSIYAMLDYDAVAISDYQKINTFGIEKPQYVPVYEHGYGIFKNHQVLIGADKVLWRDYPLFQNLHNKQHILNLLRNDNDLVYIAHPRLRSAYAPEDMKYLTAYDGIEVLNYFRVSREHWDSALSAGRPVTILGNDDAHDIFNPDEVGFRCTYIYSPHLTGEGLVKALKQGQAFGADLYRPTGESFETKTEKANAIPELVRVEMDGDTLTVEVSEKAMSFNFIGQGGESKGIVRDTHRASYVFTPGDTYIRAQIGFYSFAVFYLNPVFRFDGQDPWAMETARVDPYRTWLLRILGFATLIFIIFNIYFIRKRIRKKRNATR